MTLVAPRPIITFPWLLFRVRVGEFIEPTVFCGFCWCTAAGGGGSYENGKYGIMIECLRLYSQLAAKMRMRLTQHWLESGLLYKAIRIEAPTYRHQLH